MDDLFSFIYVVAFCLLVTRYSVSSGTNALNILPTNIGFLNNRSFKHNIVGRKSDRQPLKMLAFWPSVLQQPDCDLLMTSSCFCTKQNQSQERPFAAGCWLRLELATSVNL
ncbi:hypothetical protein HKD37_12G035210 [Glycine soja]